MRRRTSRRLPTSDNRRPISLVLVVLAVIAAAGSFQWLRQRSEPLPTTAEMVVLSGQVSIIRADAGIEGPLQEGQITTLQRGDEIHTAPDSRAKLNFGQDAVAELGGDAQVTILDLYETAMSRSLMTMLALQQGELETQISHVLFQGMRFVIETRIATVEAKGTLFTCAVMDSQHVQVSVRDGIVEVSMGEQTLALEAGQSVDAILGQPLTSKPLDQALQAPAPVATPSGPAALPTYTELQKTLFPPVETPTRPGDDLERYTVQAGDTLSSISRQYGIPWQVIYEANRSQLASPDALKVGQEIIIPRH